MPLRYRILASYGIRSMRSRTASAAIRSPSLRRHQSTSSSTHHVNRPIHTTSLLQIPAHSPNLLQDDDDDYDEALREIEESFVKETFGRNDVKSSEFSLLDSEVLGEENTLWNEPLTDLVKSKDEIKKERPQGPLRNDVLSWFDPDNRPKSLEEMQFWLECESQQDTVKRMEKSVQSARSRQDYASMGGIQKLVLEWFAPLKDAIEAEQILFLAGEDRRVDMNRYGPHLCTLPAEKLAIILTNEAILHCLNAEKRYAKSRSLDGVKVTSVALTLGTAVETEVNVGRVLQQQILLQRLKNEAENQDHTDEDDDSEGREDMEKDSEEGGTDDRVGEDEADKRELSCSTTKWSYEAHHLQKFLDDIFKAKSPGRYRIAFSASRKARRVLDSEATWEVPQKVKLGAAMLEILLRVAKVRTDSGKTEPAFSYQKKWYGDKVFGTIIMHDSILKMVFEDSFDKKAPFSSRYMPMVVPPVPWTSYNEGGYKWLKASIMRTKGSNVQKAVLRNADLTTAFDGLNVLGRVPWRINREILDVAQACWNQGIAIGDIPSHTDFEVPPQPIAPERVSEAIYKSDTPAAKKAKEETAAYRDALKKFERMKQKNCDLVSLRCTAILKLHQAEKFKEFDEIYFPYNLDFRGRVYPIPPHLSVVGSDASRALLIFAKSKPLGSRGLYWLKVHLANLAGNDKISFDERANFAEEHMDDIRAAAEDPLGENRWWMTLDDPFQGLATCFELIKAIDSGDPESYECALPIHMDGSCNGLQHYAALGRDKVGGKAVNLCREDRPQDVYSEVMEEVKRVVAAEAAIELDIDESREDLTQDQRDALKRNRAARLVNGLIDRGVVKRTVMTSVYGVTFVGARAQIQEKIEEKLEATGLDVHENEHEINQACNYLASVTMEKMFQLFSGARETMKWLTDCARLISHQGQPVAWVSPIGVPVVQPYRQSKAHRIITLLQEVVLVYDDDDLPIHKSRQVSAFPPNYVHSLDSAHMILTALEMDKRGLTFSSVHDSFWTHACDVDEMNQALRDTFVDLYQQPLLERLKKTWELRYPMTQFPDLPDLGNLDLNDVRSAPYFFQ